MNYTVSTFLASETKIVHEDFYLGMSMQIYIIKLPTCQLKLIERVSAI